jgi:hypothetical protein
VLDGARRHPPAALLLWWPSSGVLFPPSRPTRFPRPRRLAQLDKRCARIVAGFEEISKDCPPEFLPPELQALFE